jgi:hypothetical protein
MPGVEFNEWLIDVNTFLNVVILVLLFPVTYTLLWSNTRIQARKQLVFRKVRDVLGGIHIDPYISYNCSSAIFIDSNEDKVGICRFPWWQEKPEIFVFSARELIEAKIDSDCSEVSVTKEIQASSNFAGIADSKMKCNA